MLHTHDDFLKAIAAEPAERTLRLVFADWLTEHDDPRGDLIRIEEEMRALPVFADRFWELKPQRNELRAQAGPDWCGRMRYGTECEPVFRHGIPDGWRERWRLIREFTERWHGIPMPDVGGRQAAIAKAARQLEQALPASVQEWVAFAEDVAAAPNYSGELQQMGLRPVSGTTALSLRYVPDPFDRFLDYHSAVLAGELHYSDPPVRWFYSEFNSDDNHSFVQSDGKPEAESVTAFALTHVVNLTAGSGGGFTATIDQLADLYRHLKRSFPSHVEFGEHEWDEADNLLIEITPVPTQRGLFDLIVAAAAPIRKEQVPDFLWHYARLSRNPRGIFASR